MCRAALNAGRVYEESRTGGRMTATVTVTAELRPPSGGNPEPGGDGAGLGPLTGCWRLPTVQLCRLGSWVGYLGRVLCNPIPLHFSSVSTPKSVLEIAVEWDSRRGVRLAVVSALSYLTGRGTDYGIFR